MNDRFSPHQPDLTGPVTGIPIPNPPDPTRPVVPPDPPPSTPATNNNHADDYYQHYCTYCGGTGFTYSTLQTPDGTAVISTPCQSCDGVGDLCLVACFNHHSSYQSHQWLKTTNLSHRCLQCQRESVAVKRQALEELL